MKSSVMEYSNIQSVPFDGTTSPISHVPNWLNSANFNKSLRYSDIPTSEFIRVPMYDADVLLDTDTSNKIAALTRGTYITTYMGSYRMNFTEYDGSHVGIDIRAPLGTPVVALANGVVVKVKNTEGSDGKYIIIRHDNIVFDGRVKSSYYSSYLHMDNLVAIE
jgi:murein DD-endopeptidase MepM/ murein hydrolase activator NlpD